MMRPLRAQASLEYMSAYVWAGIALLAAAGSLAYFGFFDSGSFAKEECSSGSQIACVDTRLTEDGVFSVMVRNDLDKRVIIKDMSATYRGSTVTLTGIDSVLTSGDSDQIPIQFDRAFEAGKKESVSFTFTYARDIAPSAYGYPPDHVVAGSATVEVTAP